MQDLFSSVHEQSCDDCSLTRPCCVTCRGSPQAAPRTAPPARGRASPMARPQAPSRHQSPQPWVSCTGLRASRACWEVHAPMHVSHGHVCMRPHVMGCTHDILCIAITSPQGWLRQAYQVQVCASFSGCVLQSKSHVNALSASPSTIKLVLPARRSTAEHLEWHCVGSETPQYASPASKASGTPSARRTPAQGMGASSWTHSALKEMKVPQACPSHLAGSN